jgi:hypothetical protein
VRSNSFDKMSSLLRLGPQDQSAAPGRSLSRLGADAITLPEPDW